MANIEANIEANTEANTEAHGEGEPDFEGHSMPGATTEAHIE